MPTNIRELVQAQVAEKIAKGETLAAKIDAVDDAQAALDAANKDAAAARRDALGSGWTENELKRLGLAVTRTARSRGKSRAASSDTATSE